MPWKIIVTPEVPYLEAFVSGEVSKSEVSALYLKTLATARSVGLETLLADCRSMRGGLDLGEIYELSATRLTREKIRFHKEALVLPTKASAAELVKFWETTSINRGFNVKSFTARQRAIDWLLADGT